MTHLDLDRVAQRRPPRVPGLYVEHGVRHPPTPPRLLTGVPAFVGFGDADATLREHAGSPAIVVDRWDERLWRESIVTAADGFLRAAVRGFHANGGRRCVLFVLPPETTLLARENALLRLLAPGGPLEQRSDVDLLCLPDASQPLVSDAGQRAVYAAALRHCEAMGDRFALLDAPAAGHDEASTAEWLALANRLRSSFGALYAPWILTASSLDATSTPAEPGQGEWRGRAPRGATAAPAAGVFVPACGHVAGLIARLDRSAGTQRSPANELLQDALDTAGHLSPAQRARLNAAGVNCIHGLRGVGVRVEGARTLSARARWTYLANVRVVLEFRRWVEVRLRDLVFEPNTPALWEAIHARLVAHCLGLQRAGALSGDTPDEAFFVQCDAETNPIEQVQAGRVTARVGLALAVPAEFIVVHVVQDARGFTVGDLSGS